MPKQTIKALEARIETVVALRNGDIEANQKIRGELEKLKAENEILKNDKQWLKSMHSSLIQATIEIFRKR